MPVPVLPDSDLAGSAPSPDFAVVSAGFGPLGSAAEERSGVDSGLAGPVVGVVGLVAAAAGEWVGERVKPDLGYFQWQMEGVGVLGKAALSLAVLDFPVGCCCSAVTKHVAWLSCVVVVLLAVGAAAALDGHGPGLPAVQHGLGPAPLLFVDC